MVINNEHVKWINELIAVFEKMPNELSIAQGTHIGHYKQGGGYEPVFYIDPNVFNKEEKS